MKKVLTIVLVCISSIPVWADFASTPHVAGSFDGWAMHNPMTDLGDGIWEYKVTGMGAGARYEFKITQGDWDSNYPGANSWCYADDFGSITITFNANTVNDGWEPAQYRLGLNADPGTWTIAGSFQGWNNANPDTAMTPLGGGFYYFSQALDAGEHKFKPVVTGSWDSISWDARSVGTQDYTVNFSSAGVLEVYVDALTGTLGVGSFEVEREYLPHDPDPDNLEKDVLVDGLVLSWAVAQASSETDPNVLGADPNLVSHKLYMTNGSQTDPNLYLIQSEIGWDSETLRASYMPSTLLKDASYQWRVDMVVDDSNDIPGIVWKFDTELTTPSVTDPDYQVVEAGGTAVFEVTATSATTPGYQWYKYVDGVSDIELSEADSDISGVATDTLTIENVELADEGGYYCVVNNDSGIPAQSAQGLLGVKRLIAKWDFESGNANSTVDYSPASFLYNDPEFVTDGGIVGDGMQFDDDPESPDLLYTDPDEASYFDICNKSMTLACWIKSGFAAWWGPMIARNGEANQGGWQFRHNGDTLDRICFTTRGTGSDVGRPSNRTVYDGVWHYAVATYDGSVKKVYIDGVVCRVYNAEDGSIASESEEAGGLIDPTPSPVSLAGRVKGDSISGLVFEQVTPCILDEVEIYNYALDAQEIAQHYAYIAGVPVCPEPMDYDLDGDCIVNLNDLQLLASAWLNDTSAQPTN